MVGSQVYIWANPGKRVPTLPAAEVGGEWGKVRNLQKLDGWVVMVDLHQVYDAAVHQNAGNNQGAMSDVSHLWIGMMRRRVVMA